MSTMGNSYVESRAEVWRQTASRIADELKHDRDQDRLAKVSSLLHAFRAEGVHCDIKDMVQALREQGVRVRSGGPEISRRDALDLGLNDGAATGSDAPSADAGIRVSHWRAGEVGRPVSLGDAPDFPTSSTDVVRWFDVDPRGSDPSPESVRKITAQLQPWCAGLDEMIVRDLMTPDALPKSETYGDERTGIRTVSVPALVTREILDDDDDFDGVDEQLVLQIVELVVGPGWMITCWHSSRTILGGGVVREGPSLLREPFVSHVGHRWLHDPTDFTDHERAKDACDLAIYLARSLVATYGASLRMLQRWVSSWEVNFYMSLGDQQDRGTRWEAQPSGSRSRTPLRRSATSWPSWVSSRGA